MNLCVKFPQGPWNMCTIHHTKMNCDKGHVNTDINLYKTHTSGALSKDKELHQVDTSLEIKKIINKQETDVVKQACEE